MYITQEDDLAQFCERAQASRVIAVDTEFLREKTYHPKLCLIQIATATESAAIDPLLIEDLTPVRELMENKRITKVFHACTQDLEVIKVALDCVPKPVFDTQLAAAFLGYRQQIGYGALVEATCNVHLPKAESLTDWSRRPLDKEQLAYAEDDVIYLPRIYAQMMDELVEKNRLSWLEPEMRELAAPSHFMRLPEEAYLHLKRASSLTRRQLAIAREVAAWRERTAARRDVPRKWVVSDEVVVEACKRAPKSVDRLRRIRGTEQVSDRDARDLVAAVVRGMDCDPQTLPVSKRHDRPSPETEGVIDLMYALLRLVSQKTGIATQLIATRDDILDFMNGRKDSSLASGWRYDIVGKQLEQLLAGQIGLTIKDGKIETL